MPIEQVAGLFVVSAGLGALIGLVRQWGWQQEHREDGAFAGVRTFTLWALLGCTSALLAGKFGAAVFPVMLVTLGVYLAVARLGSDQERSEGYTTFAALLLTFLIGALTFAGPRELAVVLAAGTMVVVGTKQRISEWTRKFTATDMRQVLQFAAITGVVLPLVPNHGYGPFGALNPFDIWLMVVLMAGIGFVGYVLVRLYGARAGITLTGLVGGLASSTATTLTFSRRSREAPEHSIPCALAVILACDVMVVRVAVMVSAIDPGLGRQLLVPFALLLAPGVVLAVVGWWQSRLLDRVVATPEVTNPLGLRMAIRFALLYAGIKLAVKAAVEWKIATAILPIAALSGLTDMDAIALSIARSVTENTITGTLAAQAIIVAAIANTVLKGTLAASLGSPALRWRMIVAMGLIAAAGAAAFFIIPQ
jgi:uncharacterized membrane protein (DUF4010 family)